MNRGIGADYHVVVDGGKRVDVHVFADLRRGADDGQRADADPALRAAGGEVKQHDGKGAVHVVHLNNGHAFGGEVAWRDNRGGAAVLQIALALVAVDEGDVAGPGGA